MGAGADGARAAADGTTPHAWVVAPKGAVDIASCGALQASLDEVVDSGATIVVLDLGDVDFIDSSGIRVIVRTGRRLNDAGGRLLVENTSGATQRILEVTGILEHLRDSQ
jgi:anti-anti-sigma factor